jgi:hypothetical protein
MGLRAGTHTKLCEHSGLHLSHRVAVVLLVIFGQNIALAIVAQAYHTAKERYGLPRTSFVMLIPLRIMFFVWLK